MTGLIERFGVLGVFLLMVPESACIPVPSEVTLLFSGFAVHQGWMSFPLAILAATAGNLVGSLLAYLLGASRLLERVALARGLLERWGRLLERHGTRAVFIARLLPLTRTFVSLPAGAQRVPLARFVALTTVGCALWATGFVLAGMIAASAWASLDSIAGRVLLILGLVVMIGPTTRGLTSKVRTKSSTALGDRRRRRRRLGSTVRRGGSAYRRSRSLIWEDHAVDDDTQGRIAANEALLREVNEAIERGRWPGEENKRMGFRCECARLGCDQVIDLTIGEYERVRARPRRFVLAEGHEVSAAESVVESGAGWAVVEKRERAGEIAQDTDPRG